MSEPQQPPQPGVPPGDPEQLTPEQEEMLRRMEEEMRTVRVQDVITQSVVSILNLAARRIAKEDERDLDQAKLGIDAVAAMVDHLEAEPQKEVRSALSQLQMMYAQHAGGGGGGGEAQPGDSQGGQPDPGTPPGGPQQPPAGQGGPGKSRLWTPGS